MEGVDQAIGKDNIWIPSGKRFHPRSIKYGQFIGPKSHTATDMLP
jgi:hypothetical protein